MKFHVLAFSLAAAVAASSHAFAATVTYSTAISGGSGPGGSTIDADDFATFTQFNPALGTLNSVTMSFSLQGSFQGSLSIFASKVTSAGAPVTIALSPVGDFYYPGPDLDDPLQSENRLPQAGTVTAPMPVIDSSTNPYATAFFTNKTFPTFAITDGAGMVISSAGATGTGTVTEEYYDPYLWGILTNLTDSNASAYFSSSPNPYTYTGTTSLTYDYTPAALLGDANGDGKVDLSDLNIVLNNLGLTTSLRSQGNFDGAATIDLTDLNDVLNNLGVSSPATTTAALSGGVGTAVPEPASLSLLGVAGFIVCCRRKLERETKSRGHGSRIFGGRGDQA